MDHVAIMNPRWKLIPKIISGEKTIESRWYQTRRAPWNQIKNSDRVFFKDSGKRVTAMAHVSGVMQFELSSIDDAQHVINRYGKEICLVNTNPATWGSAPRYCILIRLRNPRSIAPFAINKAGFGNAAAWIVVDSIEHIRI